MPMRFRSDRRRRLCRCASPWRSLRRPQDDATEQELEKYRQMLKADPWSNPGLLDADRGEALWKEKRGPKNASLEQCDLGKGPGKVEGAFAELPRYFKDADRVMDLEVAPGVVHGDAAGLRRARRSSSGPTPRPTSRAPNWRRSRPTWPTSRTA